MALRKAAAELVFAALYRSFFRQRPDLGVVTTAPAMLLAAAIGHWIESFPIASGPCKRRNRWFLEISATRPWQHVLDTLYGYLHLGAALANDLRGFGAWNFGGKSTPA